MWDSGQQDDPFAGQAELVVEQLVAEVLARNRSLFALRAAWQAAAERYPQAITLQDPVLMSLFAPGSFRDQDFQSSYMVGGSQAIPWPGKRWLRGEEARANTSAAYFDVGDVSIRLAAAARTAFFDYFVVYRELDLVDENTRRLKEFRGIAKAKYETNTVTQQDVLQADVDLAELSRQRVELERTANVTAARINTLLHRVPDFPLPPPPRDVILPRTLPDAPLLYQLAVQRRPDLAAIGARIRAEQVALQLAYKEYFPDFDINGRYDQFWDRGNQRGQVGMNLNIPLYQARRSAAVREAMFRINQRRAEYERQIDDIRNEVQAAYEQVNQGRQVVEIYRRQTVPSAHLNVLAARAGYETGQVSFLALIMAQRQLIMVQIGQAQALAEYHRRLAELERAMGGPVPPEPSAEEIQAPPGQPARP